MNRCEHLSEGKCLAFQKIDGWKHHGDDIATHIPKFCAVEQSFTGDETNIKMRLAGKCLAENDLSKQEGCNDFKEKPVIGGTKSVGINTY